MLGKRIINTGAAGAACTTDTVQILDGVPFDSIATYEFESNANDLTGNYNGTATNVTYATGKFGNAAVFNGSSSQIQLPLFNRSGNVAYSFSAWVYLTSSNVTGSIVAFFDGSVAYNQHLLFNLYQGRIQAGQYGSVGYAPNTLSLNTWHHLTFSRDTDNSIDYYENGTRVTLKNNSDGTGSDVNSFATLNLKNETPYIGRHGTGSYFNGKIDQVRIYDKALSAANVAELYAETPATSQTNISLNAPSGVAYYKMNDATDETGSYDGTPTNVDFNVAGKFGNAGEFNGSSKIDTGIDLDTYDETWSISLWVKFTFNSSYRYIAGDLSVTTALNGFTIDTSTTGQIRFRFRNSSGSVATITSPNTYGDGNWHHITGVKGSSNNYLYIDGSQVGSVATVNGISHSTNLILGQVGAFNGFYLGSIDQVRIFDRAITSDEVTTLYDEVYCQPTIVPTDYFEPVLYTGNGTDITVNTGLKPDMVWIKERTSTSSHRIVDSVRGDKKRIFTNVTNAESEVAAGEVLLDNGFQVGADNGSNQNGEDYVAWNWKAGGAAVSNTDGTITSQVSANTDAGFSIVKYSGAGSSATVGHGLSTTPDLIITKGTTNVSSWDVWHKDVPNAPYLNDTGAASGVSHHGTPNSTTFGITHAGTYNTGAYITYAFHSVDGYSKIGSYTGTGASGNSIVTGFRPAFVMIKVTNDSASWGLFDNKRGGDLMLRADATSADVNGNNSVSFASNGFTLPETGLTTNASGKNYIYLAFAEENAQPEPVLANSFNIVTYTGNGSTQAVTGLGFQPDLLWVKNRDQPDNHRLVDSIRGATNYIAPNLTNAENTSATNITSFDSNGFSIGTAGSVNTNNEDYVAWGWKASNDSTINNDGSISSVVSANPASGFSVVKFNGNGAAQTIGHGLDSAPELIITKGTMASPITDWATYSATTGATKYLVLNGSNAAISTTAAAWNNTDPTSSVFSVGTSFSYSSGIAYCFHSTDNQKVGSYTGNATSREVDTGFQPRFVMVKRTNAVGNWEIWDSLRNPSADNNNNDTLFANSNAAEADAGAGRYMSFDVDGFTISGDSGNSNASGSTYIYLAIA